MLGLDDAGLRGLRLLNELLTISQVRCGRTGISRVAGVSVDVFVFARCLPNGL